MEVKQDNSNKTILARGCDANLSAQFAKAASPALGNPRYVPTTTDDEFLRLLREEKWSVIYFAPGACRFSAAGVTIPGASTETRGWTLDDYRPLIEELQGADVAVVESLYEEESFGLLASALNGARATR